MDLLEDRYLIVARKVMSILGFWPFQSYNERFPRSCIVSFSLIYGVLAQLCQFFTLDFNLRSIILVLQWFVPMISIVSIYSVFELRFVTIQQLLSWILLDCLELKDEIELRIMQEHVNETKLYITIFTLTSFFFIGTIILPSILHICLSTNKVVGNIDRYPLFSCVDYFLGQEHYYYSAIVYQISTGVIALMVGISIYSMYIWFIQYACARLSIVKSKLHESFINYHHRNDDVLVIQKDHSNRMIDIIQHYTRTVQFIALTNKLGEASYLFQMSMALLLLAISLLGLFEMPSLLKQKEDKESIFAFTLFILTTFLVAYVNCYVGQKLLNYSTEVYTEVSLVPIHEVSLKTQKLLLTMLMLHSKPCAISIGKMFVSSHAFFSDLVRSSLSFAMVLYSTQSI